MSIASTITVSPASTRLTAHNVVAAWRANYAATDRNYLSSRASGETEAVFELLVEASVLPNDALSMIHGLNSSDSFAMSGVAA